MPIQALLKVCSAVHIHDLSDKASTIAAISQAIKDSAPGAVHALTKRTFDLAGSSPSSSAKMRFECGCENCYTFIKHNFPNVKVLSEVINKVEASKILWNYRYIIAFTDEGQVYQTKVLEEYGFKRLQEYSGYQGKPVIIWGMHIPSYYERTGKLE